ncbi:hypothetical protein P8807_18950 [Bacillus subtilis]|uniref:hypothetical protein n=1 Tax=Bacillus subtilis TaxID=1423 RepID=UPI002DBB71CD|nr:hypothetical protein [Bacillus subtilis]MEC0413605.1 hypothetical protein [Bacillus subtilis]MEC0423265.1 hypothetical protein [Bacillus subtilis]
MRKRRAFTVRLQKRTAEDEREPVPLAGSRLFCGQDRPPRAPTAENLAVYLAF